ncbi:MAG: hypothetical protein GY754_19465 [bacterium]|nr:hypothetical protein [bacterium]
MKKILFFLLIGLISFSAGCSRYTIKNQNPASVQLKKYQKIHIGWIDLDEEKWKPFGYDSKEKWVAIINDMNLKSLPQYLKNNMPKKIIATAKSKDEAVSASEGLKITFSNVLYNAQTSSAAQIMFGSMGGSDTLDMVIHFIDAKTSKEIYNVTISVDSKGGTGYSSMGFEGRINNTIYNLAGFLNDKLEI